MIFWKGYGILVLVITIAIEAVISIIFNKAGSSQDTAMAVGLILSSVIIWIAGNKINSSVKSRTLIDKQTGQEFIIKPDHTFFFIKMQYWAFIVGGFGLIILISNSVQHNNYKGVFNENTNEEIAHQQEKQIQQQAYMDSINKAKAIADSIEQERKQRLIEEDKQRKILDATDFIKAFSTSFMQKVSPSTGKNLTYNIIDSESTNDDLTHTIDVVFETSWDAIPDYNWNSPYQTHIYKGKLILYGTGETRLEEISKNAVLIRAINASNAAQDILDWLDKNSDNNSNNNSN